MQVLLFAKSQPGDRIKVCLPAQPHSRAILWEWLCFPLNIFNIKYLDHELAVGAGPAGNKTARHVRE